VGAITDKYLVGLDVVKTGNGLAQRRGIRVRIKTQAVRRHPGNGGQGLWRRAVGIFVGVQLDQSLDLWLFAGHIGLELVNKIAPVTAHALLRLNGLWNSPEIIRRSRGRAFPQTRRARSGLHHVPVRWQLLPALPHLPASNRSASCASGNRRHPAVTRSVPWPTSATRDWGRRNNHRVLPACDDRGKSHRRGALFSPSPQHPRSTAPDAPARWH